ncbi:GNAT family N-acetyltransferase [Streptomyces lydicus]|uniref:GNAT family N-acetyltransferase n=1 Tax=Streptomyces lydicus TaxID=47763 RepID=UPI0037A71107
MTGRGGGIPLLPWRDTLTVQELEGPEAHAFLAVRWPALYAQDRLATPFQSFAWLRGWATQRPTSTPLVLVAEYAPGRPAAALALTREVTDEGGVRITPLGSPAAEYIRAVGPCADEPHVAGALVQRLTDWAADGAAVVMPDVPTGSRLGQLLAAEPGWSHTTVACAQVPVPMPYAAMSRVTRRDHVRRERTWTALEMEGRVDYRRSSTADELAAGTADAQHLHRRRWASHPTRVPPLDGLLEVLRHCGPTEAFAAVLRLDGCPVAAMVCLHRGPVAYSLLPAMDPAVADLAPGHALHRRLLADLDAAEFEVLDLGRTRDEPGQISYKSQYLPSWTSSVAAHGPSASSS